MLITGGSDKNIDFEPVKDSYAKAAALVLLAGTGTDKLIPFLKERNIAWKGPYDNLDSAIRAADEVGKTWLDGTVFHTGCASFGMFLHEFDRGKKFKEGVRLHLGL